MHLPAPPGTVFDTLDSAAGRAAFWAESAIEVNGHIQFRFIDGSVWSCRILERQRPRVFSLDYMGAPVRFELAHDGAGGTDLLLTHDGVDAAEWNEVHAGWLNVLFPLKAWLMAGIDLRNHDAARSWEHGYADQ